jgi:hypothetical protein
MQEQANYRLDKLLGMPRQTQAPTNVFSRFQRWPHPRKVCGVCHFRTGGSPVITAPEQSHAVNFGPHGFGGFFLRWPLRGQKGIARTSPNPSSPATLARPKTLNPSLTAKPSSVASSRHPFQSINWIFVYPIPSGCGDRQALRCTTHIKTCRSQGGLAPERLYVRSSSRKKLVLRILPRWTRMRFLT